MLRLLSLTVLVASVLGLPCGRVQLPPPPQDLPANPCCQPCRAQDPPAPPPCQMDIPTTPAPVKCINDRGALPCNIPQMDDKMPEPVNWEPYDANRLPKKPCPLKVLDSPCPPCPPCPMVAHAPPALPCPQADAPPCAQDLPAPPCQAPVTPCAQDLPAPPPCQAPVAPCAQDLPAPPPCPAPVAPCVQDVPAALPCPAADPPCVQADLPAPIPCQTPCAPAQDLPQPCPPAPCGNQADLPAPVTACGYNALPPCPPGYARDLPAPNPEDYHCENGWTRVGTSCYFTERDHPVSFDAAQSACEAKGASLITTDNLDEFNEVFHAAPKNWWTWVGLAKKEEDKAADTAAPGGMDDNQYPWLIKDGSQQSNGYSSLSKCAAHYNLDLSVGKYVYWYPCSWTFYYVCEKNAALDPATIRKINV